ncbi:GL10082 [Drosophila persimilis]|uniref:GL10082 n=1 Tax=Drosophila persimilis TaxID=7234 RepID=B4H5B2_DROPE|nr:GL10082 [Drosophila persimilis]
MLLLCLLLLHEAPLAHPYKEHLQSTFTNVSVEYSPEFCGSITGWLTPQGNLNLDIHLNRTLRQGLRTAITLQQRVGGGYQTLFSYDLDTCRTLGELLQSSLMKVWLRNVFRYGHLATRCPIQPAHYDLRDFQLENHSIPGYLRPGLFRLNDTNYYRRPRGGRRRLVATFTLDIKFY